MDTSSALRVCLLAAANLLFIGGGQAQSRCDCATIVDTCSATLAVESDQVAIASDQRQCARVDYLIDGAPFVALVVDGAHRQQMTTTSGNPELVLQSCQVCADNAAALPARPPQTDGGDASADGTDVSAVPNVPLMRPIEPARLIAVNPVYPPAAMGSEGQVEVSYTVTPLGRVEDARVTAAEPPGLFEQAALTAIARWRYDADDTRPAVEMSHRFDFTPDDASRSPSAGLPATAVIDSLIARAAARRDDYDAGPEAAVADVEPIDLNHCVREEAVFNFGEMVEIDLMNTCIEALIVFSCTEGMGREQGRWACRSTESARSVLVRPGDQLVGRTLAVGSPETPGPFTFTENLFVVRPPNTEHWWLACDVADDACKDRGRHWVRSMNRRTTAIDPSVLAEQSVARSF